MRTPAGRHHVIVLGAKQVLGAAIAACFGEAGYLVEQDPLPGGERDVARRAPHAVVLVSPVVVDDYATRRTYRADVDVFDGRDPRAGGRIARADASLGDLGVRRYIEAVAGPGTRVALVSASLCLVRVPGSHLDELLGDDAGPLLIHTQVTLVRHSLADEVPDLFAVGSLPFGNGKEGWGLTGVAAMPQRMSETPALIPALARQEAEELVERLAQLRRTADGLVAGDVPF